MKNHSHFVSDIIAIRVFSANMSIQIYLVLVIFLYVKTCNGDPVVQTIYGALQGYSAIDADSEYQLFPLIHAYVHPLVCSINNLGGMLASAKIVPI